MTNRIKNIFYTGVSSFLFLPALAFAQSGSAGCPAGQLCNPLGGSASDLPGILSLVLNNVVVPVGGILCALVIIYSGFLFVTARGEPDAISKAKQTFFYAVIGTLVLLGAATIASIIQTTINQLK